MEILKVSANSAPNMVAGAIASVMRSDGKVEVQALQIRQKRPLPWQGAILLLLA